MTARRLLTAACILSALCAPLAFTEAARADDAAMAEAQARFKEGLDLADSGKFEEARLKFLQAFAVLKAAAVLFNLATAEQKTGHDVEAIEHYRAFLKTGATDTRITDAMRDKAKQNIAELLKKVGQLEVDAPDGSKISVDGKPLEDVSKEPIPLAAGKHKLEAAWSGKIKSITIECHLGEITKAKIEFETAGPSTEEPTERTTLGWAVPIGLGVVGVAGVVTGGVFASSSQSAKTESEDLRRGNPGLCSPTPLAACSDYDAKRSSAESDATIAWVGYVAGGVFLAASIATFVFWPKASKSSSPTRGVRVTPVAGPHGGGASVNLSF